MSAQEELSTVEAYQCAARGLGVQLVSAAPSLPLSIVGAVTPVMERSQAERFATAVRMLGADVRVFEYGPTNAVVYLTNVSFAKGDHL